MTAAVCYVASSGYLFETVVSASQAKLHVNSTTEVIVVAVGQFSFPEIATFRSICLDLEVNLIECSFTSIDDAPAQMGRLYLDRVIPGDVTDLLYLDGDTQICSDLTGLVSSRFDFPVLAARDPMTLFREVDSSFRKRIDGWLDAVDFPEDARSDYINSGVLRIDRSHLEVVRKRISNLPSLSKRGRFIDQDFINRAIINDLGFLSLEYNFPGFLLNSKIHGRVHPKLIHFMSNPRPWNAPIRPWGREFFEPYLQFVSAHPESLPYAKRFNFTSQSRYRLQQRWKGLREWRIRNSEKSLDAFLEQEKRTVTLESGSTEENVNCERGHS